MKIAIDWSWSFEPNSCLAAENTQNDEIDSNTKQLLHGCQMPKMLNNNNNILTRSQRGLVPKMRSCPRTSIRRKIETRQVMQVQSQEVSVMAFRETFWNKIIWWEFTEFFFITFLVLIFLFFFMFIFDCVSCLYFGEIIDNKRIIERKGWKEKNDEYKTHW